MATEDPRIIKRYANRKLYDTTRREFTSLDELSGLLDKGIRFVVQEHDSGDDRTETVLAQVLGRRVRSGKGSGSSDLLSGLLKAPTQIAEQLLSPVTATGPDEDVPKKKKGGDKGAKKSGTSKGAGKKSGTSKGAGKKSGTSKGAGKKSGARKPKESDDDAAEIARQEGEIAELRSQVAELTQAVSMLVNDKLAQREDDA